MALILRYLLDTNILIHLIRGSALGLWIESHYALSGAAQVPLISSVTEGELRSFAIYVDWGKDKQRVLQDRLNQFVIVPIELPDIMQAYAEIDATSTRQGRKMGKNDIWIAATAHVTGARLLTTDKDFDHLSPRLIKRDWIDQDRTFE